MKKMLPLFKIYWDDEDVQNITKAIREGMHWAIGPNIEKLEGMLAEYIGSKHCVLFNSGTSALHASLLAHGIGNGDEVIVPSFTFIATANAPLFAGARPVFSDIEEKTFGLDPEDVKEKITSKTKAIIPMHYGGCPCMIRELREIADDKNLILIEDAAESLGARVSERKVGSFGDSAIFSFCANKIITTGEGGCIVTDKTDIYQKLKLIRSHGRLENSNYFSSSSYMDYITLGYNFRMSNITAALGISQLRKINDIITMRRRNAEYMTYRLSKISGMSLPIIPADYFNVYQMYTVVIDGGSQRRDKLLKHLSNKGIMTKVYFHPVHMTRFYKKMGYKCKLPITEMVSGKVLTLPTYPELTKPEMDYIVQEIKNFMPGDDRNGE